MSIAPIIFAVLALAPQNDPRLKTAFDMAKQCSDATVKGDYNKLADLTHPAIVEKAGGKAKMIESVTMAMAQMKAQGLTFDENKVEPAKEIVTAKTGLYCILPTMMKMSFNGKKITLNSFLLGVSTDEGKTWKFLDGNVGEEGLREVVSTIPTGMKFPAKTQPKIE